MVCNIRVTKGEPNRHMFVQKCSRNRVHDQLTSPLTIHFKSDFEKARLSDKIAVQGEHHITRRAPPDLVLHTVQGGVKKKNVAASIFPGACLGSHRSVFFRDAFSNSILPLSFFKGRHIFQRFAPSFFRGAFSGAFFFAVAPPKFPSPQLERNFY